MVMLLKQLKNEIKLKLIYVWCFAQNCTVQSRRLLGNTDNTLDIFTTLWMSSCKTLLTKLQKMQEETKGQNLIIDNSIRKKTMSNQQLLHNSPNIVSYKPMSAVFA